MTRDQKIRLNIALAATDWMHAFFTVLNQSDRDALDIELARRERQHAFEAGTQMERFRRLHTAGFRL